MAEFKYIDFQKHLAKAGSEWQECPAYLIHGDELLVNRVLGRLIPRLLDGASLQHNFEPIDGRNENVKEALSRLNTFSLLSGRKVVALKDARVFYSRKQNTDLFRKAREAAAAGRIPEAARWLCDLLGILGLQFEDIDDAESSERHLDGFDPARDLNWLDRTLAHAREEAMAPGTAPDVQQEIEKAIADGFPRGHYLVITTDYVDRRRTLYKSLASAGTVVDCSVPDGERSSGRGEHDALIRELVDGRLGMAGKRMEPGTVSALVERTGTDLRMLSGNLDKLVDFAGGRELITADDVVQVLQRTRQDPLYAFTNAVTDRNLPQALFYMDSLLEGGEINHPLPLLSAVINQVRKLLVIKDFMTKPTGRIWKPSMSYPMFQSRVYPAVQEFDRGLADRIQKWRLAIEDDDAADGPRKKSGRGKGPSSDLLICRQSKSPYPVFKLFLKADRFRIEELIDALQTLEAADRRLKRSGTSGRLALEQVVFRICTPKEN